MPSRILVFSVVFLFWILIAATIGEGNLGLFFELLKSVKGEHCGTFLAAVERLNGTGRFEVDFNGIMGLVKYG